MQLLFKGPLLIEEKYQWQVHWEPLASKQKAYSKGQ